MGDTSQGCLGAADTTRPRAVWPRGVVLGAAAVGLAMWVWGGCDGGTPERVATVEPPSTTSVLSRDGVIAATLPVDLVVFTFSDAITGTSVDGGLRLYIRHLPPSGLVRAAGVVREDLVARGWEVTGERHFETAVELRTSKGQKALHLARVTWIIERAGRIVLCEGIARDLHQGRLEEPLRQRCQRLEVSPLE